MNNNVNLYTLDLRYPFLDSIAFYMLSSAKEKNNLSNNIVFLPTKRACRNLSDSFLKLTKGKPVILPKLVPIGAVDADEVLFSNNEIETESTNIKDAIPTIKRQMILAELIFKKLEMRERSEANLRESFELAKELAKFLDQVQNEQLNLDDINNLVPEDYADHWKDTIKFLDIIKQTWPAILDDLKYIDIVKRNIMLLEKQKEVLKNNNYEMVIAAGSTGSLPATADLLKTIAELENGLVILPGLDMELDNESFEIITRENIETHPDFGMASLISKIGIKRKDVKDFSNLIPSHNFKIKEKSISKLRSEVLRPAITTHKWNEGIKIDKEALENIKILEAKTEIEEAKSIAIALRESLEKDNTALLITPDRDIAKRVSTELKKWNINIDDSAGKSLNKTSLGSFFLLLINAFNSNFSPYNFLSLLKHNFLYMDEKEKFINLIETKKIIRGKRPEPGIEGIINAVEKTEEIEQTEKIYLKNILLNLKNSCDKITTVIEEKSLIYFHKYLEKIIEIAEDLSHNKIWETEESEEAYEFFNDILEHSKTDMNYFINVSDFLSIFESFMKQITVRPKFVKDNKITILGPIEARMLRADLVILAGLNEDIFPKETEVGPWMGRHMMEKFGLPKPERKIGLASHDFGEFLSAPSVLLTRSLKKGGTPTIPSRWLFRLKAVTEIAGFEDTLKKESKTPYENWTKKMDAPKEITAAKRPEPSPPMDARPTELYITDIERWRRDPYEIYAKKILTLQALDPIDKEPDMADFGNIIHNALEKYILKLYKHKGNISELENILNNEALSEFPIHVLTFWQPRINKIINWFMKKETKYMPFVKDVFVEKTGSFKIDDKFTVKATADRIDLLQDGTLSITDYKTGQIPKEKEIKFGYAPQLPIEALIAKNDGFKITGKKNKIKNFVFCQLGSGNGRKTGGYEKKFDETELKTDMDYVIEQSYIGLKRQVLAFEQESAKYIARPHPEHAPKYSDYEHLARIKEWIDENDEDDI